MKMKRIFPILTVLLLIGSWTLAEEGKIQVSARLGKGLDIESADGSYKLNLSGRLQTRFTYNNLESAPDNNTFAVQRGKLKLEGHVFEPSLQYKFQTNFSTLNGGTAALEDYFVDWIPKPYFGIRFGQFKVPFLMQELTSTANQQFVDRSLSAGFFNVRRDIGIALHGDIVAAKLNYALFGVNGDGANTINTNQGLMGGARFEYSILGKYERTEGDVEDSEAPNLGLGIAYIFHDSLNSTGGMVQSGTIAVGTEASLGTFDAGYRYLGFSLQGATMITRTHEGPGLTNWGYNAQAGYFVVPKHFELALKGGGAIFNNAVPNQYEYALGLNYYFKGHAVKLQTDYTFLMNNRGLNLNDHRLRTQAQVIF